MIDLYNEYCKTYKLTEENSDGFFECVKDVFFTNEVQSLQQYEQHLDIDRLQHITSVAYLTYKICKELELDYKTASECACMHDLVYYDWRDGTNGAWHKNHGYKHPNYACLNAAELYSCKLTKLQDDIIRHHMWPLTLVPPKSKEAFVVTFADKYCATREVLYSVNKKYRDKFLKDVERSE